MAEGRLPGRAAVGAAIALLVAAGCVHTAEIDQRHRKRVVEVNRRYDQMRVESDRSWDGIVAQVDALRKFLIPVVPGSNYSPVDRVDTNPSLARLRDSCDETAAAAVAVERKGADASRLRSLVHECWGRYMDHYFGGLGRTYHAADIAGAARLWNESEHRADLEALLAFSHNAAVVADVDYRRREVLRQKAESLQRIEELRREALQLATEERMREIRAAEEENRRVWAAVAAGLQAGAASMQAQSAAAAQPRPTTYGSAYGGVAGSVEDPSPTLARPLTGGGATATGTGECSSDFSCGVGHRCIKRNYSSRGVCMKSVDEYGVRRYDMPSLDSVGPKMPASTDCQFDTDCPVMFRCERRSGACLKR